MQADLDATEISSEMRSILHNNSIYPDRKDI